MLTAIAIIPSAPVLVPELAGAAAAELADLRQAVFAAAGALPERWLAVGVGPADAVSARRQRARSPATASTSASRCRPTPRRAGDLPLCALITGWVRGEVTPGRTRRGPGVRRATTAAMTRCSAAAQLRSEIDAADEPVGVLVVADGANTLTPARARRLRPGLGRGAVARSTTRSPPATSRR